MRQPKVFRITLDPDEEPYPFELVFTKSDGSSETHAFVAEADPGARGTLTVASISRFDDSGKRITDLNGLKMFFERVMPAEDYKRLTGLIDRRDLTVPMETLGDVFNWLCEEYTGRPTQPSRSSSNGGNGTGRLSTASPSSLAAT